MQINTCLSLYYWSSVILPDGCSCSYPVIASIITNTLFLTILERLLSSNTVIESESRIILTLLINQNVQISGLGLTVNLLRLIHNLILMCRGFMILLWRVLKKTFIHLFNNLTTISLSTLSGKRRTIVNLEAVRNQRLLLLFFTLSRFFI